MPLLQPPDARSADGWSSPRAATDAWLNGPITSSVRTTDAARSLRHKRDHRASDRGVIAIDGQRSCAGVGRRDRFVTNAIARRRPPRRSLLLAGPRATHDRKSDNSIAGSAVLVADCRAPGTCSGSLRVHMQASGLQCEILQAAEARAFGW
jgi:hypothetical protein